MNTAKKKKTDWKHWLPFYLMGVPGFIYLLINNYMPLAGLQIAFKQFNYRDGMWGSKWNDFENFTYLLGSNDIKIILRNTILYNLIFIVVGMILGVAVAILLNEVRNKIAKQFYQTVILLPYLMSMVIVAYLAYAYLAPESGMINGILSALGMDKIDFYREAKFWPFILLFINQWKTIGFGMILYYSSLVGISKDYYEAAMLDGASKWQQIRYITLPLLKPTIITLLILNCGNIMRSDFGLFYQVPQNSGMLYSVTDTIDTYVYRMLMINNDIGVSSAAGFIQSIVGFVLVLTVNAIIRKLDKDNALF